MSQFCCAENILVTFMSTTSLKYSFYWSKFHGGVNVTNISRTDLAKGLITEKDEGQLFLHQVSNINSSSNGSRNGRIQFP